MWIVSLNIIYRFPCFLDVTAITGNSEQCIEKARQRIQLDQLHANLAHVQILG